MRQRACEASAEAGRRIGSAIRGLTEEERHPDEAKLDRIGRLGELKKRGVLTAAELRAEKKRVLENGAAPESRSTASAGTRRG